MRDSAYISPPPPLSLEIQPIPEAKRGGEGGVKVHDGDGWTRIAVVKEGVRVSVCLVSDLPRHLHTRYDKHAL